MIRIIEKVALSHFFELFYSIKGAEPINNKQATPLRKMPSRFVSRYF